MPCSGSYDPDLTYDLDPADIFDERQAAWALFKLAISGLAEEWRWRLFPLSEKERAELESDMEEEST
jgi:hypothetical protein